MGLDDDPRGRTYLAAERTYLAWWRTGLAAFAVALATSRIVPELADVKRWPYAVVGFGFVALGVLCIVYGERRRREVGAAVERGEFVTTHDTVAMILAVGGATLGVVVAVLTIV